MGGLNAVRLRGAGGPRGPRRGAGPIHVFHDRGRAEGGRGPQGRAIELDLVRVGLQAVCAGQTRVTRMVQGPCRAGREGRGSPGADRYGAVGGEHGPKTRSRCGGVKGSGFLVEWDVVPDLALGAAEPKLVEIGRASCREKCRYRGVEWL